MMTRRVRLRSPPVRDQPLSPNEKTLAAPRVKRRVGEMAGATAAECAAICCCCPCTVMNLLVLAVYKVPAGLCKKAMNKKKRQIAKKRSKSLLHERSSNASASAGGGHAVTTLEEQLVAHTKKEKEAATAAEKGEVVTDVVDLEKEMLARFVGAGFWRSPSQKEL